MALLVMPQPLDRSELLSPTQTDGRGTSSSPLVHFNRLKKVSQLCLISSLLYIKLSKLDIKVSLGPNKKVSYLNKKFSFLRSNGGTGQKIKKLNTYNFH